MMNTACVISSAAWAFLDCRNIMCWRASVQKFLALSFDRHRFAAPLFPQFAVNLASRHGLDERDQVGRRREIFLPNISRQQFRACALQKIVGVPLRAQVGFHA